MEYKEILEDKKISLTARAVLIYLMEIRITNLSKKGLSEELNVNRNTIIKSYKELTKAGYIKESRTSINQSSKIEFLK